MTPLATDTRGNYVASTEIVDGRVDITFGGPLAHQDIIGETLSVTPYDNHWQYCHLALRKRLLLQPETCYAGGAAHLPPTMDLRYLPTSCR